MGGYAGIPVPERVHAEKNNTSLWYAPAVLCQLPVSNHGWSSMVTRYRLLSLGTTCSNQICNCGNKWLTTAHQMLEIVLFGMFLSFLLIRYIGHPELFKKNVLEFPNSSYLGAIAISFNTIIQGLISYYDYRSSAAWVCFALWWIALVLSLLVSIGVVLVQMTKAKEQGLADVAGVWVMATVPLLSTAATAGSILPYVNRESIKCAIAVLVVAYMAWAFAVAELTFILTVFFFRLVTNKLPAQPIVASSFLPVAALSQGAFAIHRLSIFLASYILSSGFGPTQVHPPPVELPIRQATQEVIHWIGILIDLGLLAHASFCKKPTPIKSHIINESHHLTDTLLLVAAGIVQATTGMLMMLPKMSFTIGHWSLVFPLASYANAWCFLARDLRNNGMRGWAATMTVITTLLWLFCALMTVYHGFWKGSLFSAPGLEDWLGDSEDQDEAGRGKKDHWNGTYSLSRPSEKGAKPGDEEQGIVNGNSNGNGVSHGNGNGNGVSHSNGDADGYESRRRARSD